MRRDHLCVFLSVTGNYSKVRGRLLSASNLYFTYKSFPSVGTPLCPLAASISNFAVRETRAGLKKGNHKPVGGSFVPEAEVSVRGHTFPRCAEHIARFESSLNKFRSQKHAPERRQLYLLSLERCGLVVVRGLNRAFPSRTWVRSGALILCSLLYYLSLCALS